jgi:hypothetical protein
MPSTVVIRVIQYGFSGSRPVMTALPPNAAIRATTTSCASRAGLRDIDTHGQPFSVLGEVFIALQPTRDVDEVAGA